MLFSFRAIPEHIIICRYCRNIYRSIFTFFANAKRFLPRDAGREYAINGAKSKGKARGAGLVLVLTFIGSVLLFVDFSPEILIYLLFAYC